MYRKQETQSHECTWSAHINSSPTSTLYTLHHKILESYTLNPTPSNLDPEPYTLEPTPWTLHPRT